MKNSTGIALLRVSMGTSILLHGLMKLLSGTDFLQKLGGMPPIIPDMAWLQMTLGSIAMAIELVGGLLIVLGIKVRYASMAVVVVLIFAFTYHLSNIDSIRSLMQNTWPLELGLVFSAIAMLHPSPKKN